MKLRGLDSTAQNALSLAKAWQDRANELLTSEEKGIQEQMKRLMTHPIDKAVLTKMIDRVGHQPLHLLLNSFFL